MFTVSAVEFVYRSIWQMKKKKLGNLHIKAALDLQQNTRLFLTAKEKATSVSQVVLGLERLQKKSE